MTARIMPADARAAGAADELEDAQRRHREHLAACEHCTRKRPGCAAGRELLTYVSILEEAR